MSAKRNARRAAARKAKSNEASGTSRQAHSGHRIENRPICRAVVGGTSGTAPNPLPKRIEIGDRFVDGTVTWELEGYMAYCLTCDQPLGAPGVISHVPLSIHNVTFEGLGPPVALGNGSIHMTDSVVHGARVREWEQVAREIGQRRATVTNNVDLGLSIVSADDAQPRSRGAKEEEEKAALRLLAEAWERERGHAYAVSWEPTGYEDGWLRKGEEENIGVQVRHFDDELVAMLGADQKLSSYELDVRTAVARAIAAKASDEAVSPSVRKATVLALYSPVPLGEYARTQLATPKMDSAGFREVWMCPFGEQAFRIDIPTPA